MNKLKIILIFLIIGSAFFLLKKEFRFRKETDMEQNNLFCLTGRSVKNLDSINAHNFGIINIYAAFRDGFPGAQIAKISKNTIVMLTWEPYLKNFNEKSILKSISEGKYDNIINKMAADVKDYKKPLFLRFGHEMNGNWYPWSGINNNKEPNNYIEAFKRIRDIFKSQKCKNAYFVFSVNNEDVPQKTWNRFENYYPGHNNVDILGIDAYNWGDTKSWGKEFWKRTRWKSPKEILESAYERLIALSPKKPILITEIATTSSGGNKKRWIKKFHKILPKRYKAVKGYVWFDIDKETDWGVSGKEEFKKIFENLAKDEYFISNSKEQELFK
ncbi:MAG: glycoside hydrolase family 26 protein [Elusimicrobiota bacterium]